MKMKVTVLFGLGLLLGGAAFAQDYPRIEVPVDYSYLRWNPAHGDVINSHSLNGGGGGFVYNFTSYLGVKADLQGYGSTTNSVVVPSGPLLPSGGIIRASGNLFTYTFGPVVKVRTPRVQPYGQALFGGAHSNVYANIFHDEGLTSRAPSGNAFAMVIGGGVDIKLSRTISFRPAEVDYVLTRFGNEPFLPNGPFNQNSFRYLAGVNFTF
jgi:Outer membrane protein beta-barrel domain